MNKKMNVAGAWLLSAAALLCLLLCFSASRGDALVLGLDRNAQGHLFPDFIAGIKAGDYDEAMELVSNYDSLGYEKDAGELVELYKSRLIESYRVTVVNPNCGEQAGLYGEQIIDLTFLDSRKLLASIRENTTASVNEFLYQGNTLEGDEQALSFVYDALNGCLENPGDYLSTERLNVQTVYENGEWKIIIDDAFLEALYGHIGSAAAGTVISSTDIKDAGEVTADE